MLKLNKDNILDENYYFKSSPWQLKVIYLPFLSFLFVLF